MTDTVIEPFRAEHLAALRPRASSEANMRWTGDFETLARAYALSGPAMTLRIDGEVAACGGICLFWPGMGEAWCVTSALVERHPLRFCKATRAWLAAMESAARTHRVQAHVLAEDARAVRWLAWLGFTEEGLCAAYGPNAENVYRYARIRSWKPLQPLP